MTELFLKKDSGQWQRVYFDTSSGGIKLTRENPYFTQSESYTFDITLPMEILENRQFFANLHRIDRTKRPPKMKCRLMVDNSPVLYGSAKVMQVTQQQVKVQLLGGRSEVNFLSTENKEYIDELPLGMIQVGSSTATSGVRVAVSPINDETRGSLSSTYQFCLVDLALQILNYYGFTVTQCSIDAEPWNKIFVASAKQTRQASHVLPHWSPRDFFTEFCNFFNVQLDIDAIKRTVAIVSTPSYFAGRQRIQLDPVDEYTAEIIEDSHALATDTLVYDLSSSEAHDYDCVTDNIRENCTTIEFSSFSAALAAYNGMTEDERKRIIFSCPTGKYAAWEHDYSDWGETVRHEELTQIDIFAPLKRGNENETKLKICPAAIVMGEYTSGFGGASGTNGTPHTRTTRLFLPSVENPTRNDNYLYISEDGAVFGGPRRENGSTEEQGATVQELIEGEDEVSGKEEKEDRLQVIFIDDVAQTYSVVDSLYPDVYVQKQRIVGFTDWNYKYSHRGNKHCSWSLSLNPTGANYYLGQLHQNGFSFNMKAKHIFRFVANRMPDPRDIFIIHGKCFASEKIEANVNTEGFDKLMTGYFYEML